MSTVVPLAVPVEMRLSPAALPPNSIGTRFHLSLNVSSIEKMTSFLQLVLGVAPAKQRADYAKFEMDSPPLVLSLEPNPPQESGSLNHLGFRFATTADLLQAQKRIEAAGISTQREEGVECCYAKQTKFWVHDPDQRLWEFYVLEGDLEHRGGGQTLEQMVGDSTSCSPAIAHVPPTVWEHRMGSDFAIPALPSDQIRLRGTFNVPVSEADISRILCEVFMNLKSGGQVELHVLTSESSLTGPLNLPGSAACVKYVPARPLLMKKLNEAGFVDVRLTTFRSGACFQTNGLPLRETKITALKPSTSLDSSLIDLIYRGPFAEIRDDYGTVWRRGELRSVSTARWEELRIAGHEASFTAIPQTSTFSQCGQ
ncbi:MAG: ArsI/CadI family heavy metal resistance metalloenzyme [Planctomycetaceae bacterium]